MSWNASSKHALLPRQRSGLLLAWFVCEAASPRNFKEKLREASVEFARKLSSMQARPTESAYTPFHFHTCLWHVKALWYCDSTCYRFPHVCPRCNLRQRLLKQSETLFLVDRRQFSRCDVPHVIIACEDLPADPTYKKCAQQRGGVFSLFRRPTAAMHSNRSVTSFFQHGQDPIKIPAKFGSPSTQNCCSPMRACRSNRDGKARC